MFNRLRTSKVKTKLSVLISIFTLGFVLFALVAFKTLNDIRINGPYFREIAAGDDMRADILPPPEFIVESYLTSVRMLYATSQAEKEELFARAVRQRTAYYARQTYWANDVEVNNSTIKDELLKDSRASADRFYEIRDEQFIPAVKHGDLVTAEKLIRTTMKAEYVKHRAVIDAMIPQLDAYNLQVKAQAQQVVVERTYLLIGLAIFIIIATSLGAGFGLSRSISHTLTETVNSLSSTSAEMGATVEQQERTAVLQASAVHETTTTMDELDASFSQTAEMVRVAADTAQNAATVAGDGIETVRQTLDGMSRLKDKVAAVSEQISNLSEQTSQIGVITRAVSDLANQTNMLALNAAVEAARAGEHGKGFGVVAAEIRKLADESKKSAERINSLIDDIQKATDATVMATEEGTKTVDADILLAQQTARAFNGIVASSNSALEAAQQTLLAVPQQVAAVRQVLSAMEELNRGAKETADGLGQTKVSVENLREAALNLKAMV